MNPEAAADAEAWGVFPGHQHVNGDWVPASPRGVAAALRAMRADRRAPPRTATWVVSRNWGVHVPFEADLELEDGATMRVSGHVPREELPLGYHWLTPLDGGERIKLIVSPGECPRPPRMWGWAVQLYGARSKTSWGIGDLGDLRRVASWKRSGLGGGMLMVNPLHAVAPCAHQEDSPYLPTSRLWRNPIYIRVSDVAGSADVDLGARVLNDDRLIHRDEVWRQKRKALSEIFAAGIRTEARAWIEAQPGLGQFATWCALADIHGPDWRDWPADLRRADSPAVAAWASGHPDEVRFHAWLQWLLHLQLGDASKAGSTIVHDLAIGTDPGGADAWVWQDLLAPGIIVGAPPDEFNPEGQMWGMPPMDPWRLRAAQYEPFIQLVRAAFAGGGGVRIDHVIGLFRLFWVPADGGAADGAYVRYPWEDLLNILALEADRADAFVIGEDLGTVDPEVREELAARAILSYQLLWFEDRPPSDWRELAVAALTTHDLPTFAGLRTGADSRARKSLGLSVDAAAERRMTHRLAAVGESLDDAYRALSASPALIAVGCLDDALGVEERPNHPGTIDEWPNWRLALPEPLEQIEVSPSVRAAADALASGSRS